MGNWNNFFAETRDAPPREQLVKALRHVVNFDHALDIGAGALRDTKFLLEAGFNQVMAIDPEPVLLEFAKSLNNKNLEVKVTSIESYDLDPESYDIINAQYVLPFTDKAKFENTMSKIKQALKIGGVFTGTFFGIRDSWNGSGGKAQIFLNSDQVKDIFSGFTIKSFTENEEDGATVGEELKHWHRFHVTAIKL